MGATIVSECLLPVNIEDELLQSFTASAAQPLLELVQLFAQAMDLPYVELTSAGLIEKIAAIVEEFTPGREERQSEEFCAQQHIPQTMWTRDLDRLRAAGSLQSLVERQHAQQAPHRFNLDRCLHWFKDDPEFDKLQELARSGAIIDTPADFVHTTTPNPLRPIVRRMPNTFLYHAFKLWKANAALVVPTAELGELAGCRLHYSDVHRIAKQKVFEGRFLGDCTNASSGSALNSEETKLLVAKRFGALCHPTIRELVRMILSVAHRAGGLHNIRLWKEDISGAFGQFNYAALSAPLLAFAISDLLTLVHVTGMFGWTGSPYVFGVFTRALSRLLLRYIDGDMRMYVDDIMAASLTELAHSDQATAQRITNACISPSAINVTKTLPPSVAAEFIGWWIDLIRAIIRPSDRGIRKIVFAFFSVDASGTSVISCHQYQVMASLACRYSEYLTGARPFVRSLFRMSSKSQVPSSSARISIIMWRVIGALLLNDPDCLALSLERAALDGDSPVDIRVISDAGPRALGLAIYTLEDVCLKHVSYALPFDARDPKYQNVREFMGVVLAMMLLIKLGYRHTTVHWTGDNMSGLAWARDNMCNSDAALAIFTAYSWLSIKSGIVIVHVTHKAGVTMGDIDGLSRFKTTQFSITTDASELISSQLTNLFMLCDPTTDNTCIRSQTSLMLSVITHAIAFVNR
jgi:hypothetical protein